MKNSLPYKIITQVICVVLLVILVFPLYLMLEKSLAVSGFGNYAKVFEYFNLIPNVITSIIVVGGTLIVVSIVVSMAAYAFSKLEFPHKQAVYYLILTGMMIPTSALIFPLYQIVRGLHLNNTGWSLVFPYATASACFNLMVLTNYYNALPDELIDAAKEMIESSNFTSASQKKLEDAVAKAEDVLTDGEHTSAELEKAYNDVIDAIINLERKGNMQMQSSWSHP